MVNKFLLSLILLGSVSLRLYKWSGYGLCYDESMWLIRLLHPRSNLLDLFTNTILIAKPPFFRVLLYLWNFFARDEFTLRLLPFAFGILSIFLTYRLAKILFNKDIAFISAFLMTISPFHIYYSQELTHYTLTLFLTLCSVYYFLLGLKHNRISIWIKFVIFTVLALYTSYICIFLIMFENIFFFLSYNKYRNYVKRWLIIQLIVLLLYSPWLLLLPKQFRAISLYPEFYTWIPKGSLFHILQALRVFGIGYNASIPITLLSSLLFYGFLLTGIIFNFKKDNQTTKLLTLWLFTPMVLSILFSEIARTFTYRNFIISLPAFHILVACGISKLDKTIPVILTCITILSGTSLFNYYQNIYPYPVDFYRPGVHPKRENREAAQYIISNLEKEDIVIHTWECSALPFIYYLLISDKKDEWIKQLPSLFPFPYEAKRKLLSQNSVVILRNVEELQLFLKETKKTIKRIWLVVSFWEPQILELDPMFEPNRVKDFMDRKFILKNYKIFDGVKVYLYES